MNNGDDWLKYVAVGDTVLRRLADIPVPMELRVTALSEDLITCGPWEFSRRNGAEVDEGIGWNEELTGSVLIGVKDQVVD